MIDKAFAILFSDGSSCQAPRLFRSKPGERVIDDLRDLGLTPVAILTIRPKRPEAFDWED